MVRREVEAIELAICTRLSPQQDHQRRPETTPVYAGKRAVPQMPVQRRLI